jgi:hypothetical protein
MSEFRMNERKRKYPVGMGDHIDLRKDVFSNLLFQKNW